MAGAPRRPRKPAFRGGGLSGGPDERRSHGNAGSRRMTGPERARRRTRFDPIAPPTRRGEVLGESLGMRSAVQETIHEIAAGSGSGDSPENDGASLVRAPIRAAYSFADPDRAVIFPIRMAPRQAEADARPASCSVRYIAAAQTVKPWTASSGTANRHAQQHDFIWGPVSHHATVADGPRVRVTIFRKVAQDSPP